jgi:hypothetical protein
MQARSFAAAFFAMCLLFSSVAIGTENRDGGWWNSLTSDQKLEYILGFFDGFTYSGQIYDGAELMAQADPITKKWSLDRARIIVDAAHIAKHQISHDFGNLTAGELFAGLNKIYQDYRNTRIIAREAIVVVVRSMDGTSDDETAKLLERKRKEASK